MPNTSCFQNFCQKMLLETQIGSPSSSQGFFLHHSLCFGHNKTCLIADYFHFPNTKQWYDEDWADFFTISGLPNVPETEHSVNHGSRTWCAVKSQVLPRNKHVPDLFPTMKLGNTTIYASQKKGKTPALDALLEHGRSKGELQEPAHKLRMSQVTCCGEQQL